MKLHCISAVEHPAYHLVIQESTRDRNCIYVSRKNTVGQWRIEEVPDGAEDDITSISLTSNHGRVFVHNIYNPPPLSHSSKEVGTMELIPQILGKDGKHILVGNSNLHHLR